MANRFRVELSGDTALLTTVMPHLQDPELRLALDGERVFLTSSTFQSMNSRDEVIKQAQRMVPPLIAAMRLAGLRPGEVLANRVWEETPDGPQNTTYVFAQAISLITTVPSPTILIGGKPPPLPPPIRVEVALRDERVARALALFAPDPTWFDLYKVLEVIEEDLGGENVLRGKGWATAAELRLFTRTANNFGALGKDARHAMAKWIAPKVPMRLDDATALIGRLLKAWLATK